jgi:hypothetical protein
LQLLLIAPAEKEKLRKKWGFNHSARRSFISTLISGKYCISLVFIDGVITT